MQIDYNWLPVQTKHFGLIYRPMALVSLKHARADDAWLTRLFLVDSGADITTMNAVVAQSLGIDLKSGEPFEPRVAGGYALKARIHPVTMKFDGITLPNVRVAFVEDNSLAAYLLGRLDVGDYFDVNLQGRARKTSFVH